MGTGRSRPVHVTYADIGHENGSVILYCGGLFSSRYTLAQADELAKEHHVRLICPDKPGVGGSDAVDLDRKVKTWLDIVQALIDQLHINRISLVGHSSGAIYVLNVLLHYRHILHPNRPYVALIAPWIHPSHSDSLLLATVAKFLPDWLIRQWYHASHLVTRTTGRPNLGPSTVRPAVASTASSSGSAMDSMRNSNDDNDRLGLLTRAIDEKIMEYALLENVEGISQEALFCLKRGPDGLWGEGLWEDCDGYVSLLRHREAEAAAARTTHRQGQDDHDDSKLRVDVFFADSDGHSGKYGSRWFDDCWKGSTTGDDLFCYRSMTVPETTHETIMRPESGVLGTIFSRIE
ncbi:hypothetical protein VTN00DRAFT_8707 [Thermoascus crustaceus]|uniref:uncharacterized protein n=1 Tax=Thermoascus crustaceus TaxID=5088 RepID=UPI0037434AF5